ncbi:hypothetical protein [Sneathiella sp.]|uniref:hypothetical protein n=1 Tax=Sneathiella sp. TaxID=1964365 RepID=UPI00356B3542
MKRRISRSRRARNDYELPLFAWAESVRRRARPLAVSHIQRLGVRSPSVAALVAELAGLNVGADHE